MSKKIMMFVIITIVSLLLLGCGQASEQKVSVVNGDFGVLNSDDTLTSGYKFSSAERNFAVNLNIQNDLKEDAKIETAWQYRQNGTFHEIIRTDRNATPGVSSLSFPFKSNQEMYNGEYLVDVYYGEKLITAYRFWLVTPGKELNEEIGIYELSKCSIKLNDEACATEDTCESISIKADNIDKPFSVCEAKKLD